MSAVSNEFYFRVTAIIPSEDLIYCATVKVIFIPYSLLSRSCEQFFSLCFAMRKKGDECWGSTL